MGLLNKLSLKRLWKQLRTEGVSMRRRFVVYIISAVILMVCLVLLLLNLFGILNPTGAHVTDILDTQLCSYRDNIERDYDQIAAYAISFSHQLESQLQNYLTEQNISFSDLENDPQRLFDLQNRLYQTVYLHMQLSPCSGAFYILDTTVNSNSSPALYNGIYLKYVNLHSQSTLNNSFCLYRGSFTTGKENNLTFHSGWQNEMRTDFFDSGHLRFASGVHYLLSPCVQIPDTWERSRYVYVPLRDMKDNIIGLCGFEVNDLYFQLSERSSDSQLGDLVGALLDNAGQTGAGQFDSYRYNADSFRLTEKNGFSVFEFPDQTCIGRTQSVTLGGDTFQVALMLTQAQFDSYIARGQLKTAVIILFVLLFAFGYCLIISKKYMAPLLQRIEQLKTNETSQTQLRIREIDDLFAFLAEKDTEYEDRLKELEAEKRQAEEAYERALEEYRLARCEVQQLSDERKKEIVLEDYQFFICNLNTLTPTEYRIYELYLEGCAAAQIAQRLSITENTLKYHNKNIYSKLGISSRKQLLRFAALKQHQDSLSSG